MKYRVKLRKTIVKETIIEVELDRSIIVAMNFAEGLMEFDPTEVEPACTVTESKWVAVAIDEDKL